MTDPKPEVVVVGHWEIGWNAPITELPLWAFPLRDFGVKEWWMWPITGVRNSEFHAVDLHERETLAEILGELPNLPRVFLEPETKQHKRTPASLPSFEHPDRVVYVFGSAHFCAVDAHADEGDSVVALPTIKNSGLLWPHQVLVALLYDRLMKSWR